MRLIDADAFKMEDFRRCLDCDSIIQVIKTAPTIDPESLRPKGTWIDRPTGKYRAWQSWCSVCGKRNGIGGITTNQHKPYCPNCGAKMAKDGEQA